MRNCRQICRHLWVLWNHPVEQPSPLTLIFVHGLKIIKRPPYIHRKSAINKADKPPRCREFGPHKFGQTPKHDNQRKGAKLAQAVATTSGRAAQTLPSVTTGNGGLNRYMEEIRRFPMLKPQEEYMLAKRYADHEDRDAAHKLVTSHLRLVAKIAMGYRGYGLPISEVVSEGNVGLMQAVKKFDPEKGFRLATYAMWWIKASIQEYVLRSWSLVKMGTSANQKRLFFNLRKTKSQIQAHDGGHLTDEQTKEIAKRLNVSEQEVTSMDQRLTGDASLNAPIRAGEGETGEWQEWLVDDSESQEDVLVRDDEMDVRMDMLRSAMGDLNEREQRIFEARRLSEDPITLEELSQEFGVSRERVRQIEVRAFEKVQKAMVAAAASMKDATGQKQLEARS